MFKSQLSGKIYGPGVSPVRVIVETRPRQYENYVNGELIRSSGTEIVREILVGPDEVRSPK